MNDEIYEVSRDEYAGVIAQINPKYSDVETLHEEDRTIINIKSKYGVHFTKRIINNEDGAELYYVYNLPSAKESLPPKAIRKIVLETKEEVQNFFDALNKIQKGDKND